MILTPSQKEIAKDRHRFRVVCCGRRFGKTTLAIQEILGKAVYRESRIVYIAPTYQQARDIAWAELKKALEPLAVSINESRLEITIRNKKGTTSVIFLRGWENVDTLRGQKFDFMVIDEVAMMRNFMEQWQEVLRPTLTDTKGEAMFISTPRGYNHFYDLFNTIDEDFRSFHFTSYDNPHLPHEEIDKARLELSEDSFAQEYMADFRKAVGLAHKEWNREIHLIEPFDVPAHLYRIRGFDYGSNDPTASERIAIDTHGVAFIERCYKASEAGIEVHANAIKAQDATHKPAMIFGDPTGAQWAMEYQRYGLSIMPAYKIMDQSSRGWVEYCVERVNQLLKPTPGHTVILPDGRKIENAPHLFVLNTPENMAWVKEIESLRWKETAGGQTVPVLDEYADQDGHSDLMASTRYALVSFYKVPPKQSKGTEEPYGLSAVNNARIAEERKQVKSYTKNLDDELI